MDVSEKKKILIVDDEADIVNLTEKFLKLENLETITANNGKEAMDLLKEHYEETALVLLDIMMPGKSGYSILEEIKTNKLYRDILVILFTVKSFNEDIQKGNKLGADGYLTKPFSGKELVRYIKDKLNMN